MGGHLGVRCEERGGSQEEEFGPDSPVWESGWSPDCFVGFYGNITPRHAPFHCPPYSSSSLQTGSGIATLPACLCVTGCDQLMLSLEDSSCLYPTLQLISLLLVTLPRVSILPPAQLCLSVTDAVM